MAEGHEVSRNEADTAAIEDLPSPKENLELYPWPDLQGKCTGNPGLRAYGLDARGTSIHNL